MKLPKLFGVKIVGNGIYATVHLKAWFGGSVDYRRIHLDLVSREIRVKDDIAGYYTKCHSVSNTTRNKLLRAARLQIERLTCGSC